MDGNTMTHSTRRGRRQSARRTPAQTGAAPLAANVPRPAWWPAGPTLAGTQAQHVYGQGNTVPDSPRHGEAASPFEHDVHKAFLNDLPKEGTVIETQWMISNGDGGSENRAASGEAEDEDCARDDDDYRPSAGRQASGMRRGHKRSKKNAPRCSLFWWPGIIMELKVISEIGEDRRARAVIKYTESEQNHGVFPGAGEEYFTGDVCYVEFAGEDHGQILYNLDSAHGSRTNETPWRYMPPPTEHATLRCDTLDDVVGELQRDVARLKATVATLKADRLRQSLGTALPIIRAAVSPGVSPGGSLAGPVSHALQRLPSAVASLRRFGKHKLYSYFRGESPPSKVNKNASQSDIGGAEGLEVVASSYLDMPNMFQATQSEFAELATWVTGSTNGKARSTVGVYPSEWNLLSPGNMEQFTLSFQTYGDFCDACDVAPRNRSISIWDKWCEKLLVPQLCVIGSVKVFESAVRDKTLPASQGIPPPRTRVVLLGHSWRRLSTNFRAEEHDDFEVPSIRQIGTNMSMEEQDSRSPFVSGPGRTTAASLCEESFSVPLGGDDEQPGFDMVWQPLDAEADVPWAPTEMPGTVSFRIPVVFIRSPALVASARRLLCKDTSYPDESDASREARLKLSMQLRRAAARSPHGPNNQ